MFRLHFVASLHRKIVDSVPDMDGSARAARAHLLRVLGWQNVDPDSSLFSLGLVSVQAAILLESVKEASAALLSIYAAAVPALTI